MRTSSPRTCRRCCRSRALHVPRRGRRRRRAPHVRARHRSRRQHGRARGARERTVGRCRREGPVPALHAEGDPRAAACRGQHAAGARRERTPARAGFRPAATAIFKRHRARAHRRLRHELSRRLRGALFHRADLQDPVLGRDRERISLPQSGGAQEFPVRDDLAVRRNRRHAGRAAPREAGRVSLLARDLQRAGEFAGARVRTRDADARRSGDRRRFHQGLHDAARGAVHAGDRDRQASRRGFGARARPGAAADRDCRR
jgi:hypothetical protein